MINDIKLVKSKLKPGFFSKWPIFIQIHNPAQTVEALLVQCGKPLI